MDLTPVLEWVWAYRSGLIQVGRNIHRNIYNRYLVLSYHILSYHVFLMFYMDTNIFENDELLHYVLWDEFILTRFV